MKILLKLLSCFVALLAATLADPTPMGWEAFKTKFGKTYKTPTDEEYRKTLFMERQTMIATHNEKFKKGEVTYEMEINKFADIPNEEFLGLYTGLNHTQTPETPEDTTVTFPKGLPLLDSVNWVEMGAVSPVIDQGACASSYAFSAVGAMEGQYFLANESLVALSVQNAVDCSAGYDGNFGCFGGVIQNVYEYVITNKGIDTDASYPYEGSTSTCRFNNETIGAKFSKYQYLPPGDEIVLQKSVIIHGPISVSVDAMLFMFYKSGIFSNELCSALEYNHGMLVAGYGVDNSTQQAYWLIKNSWGTEWGEQGYIRLARNKGNMCGVATKASYPII